MDSSIYKESPSRQSYKSLLHSSGIYAYAPVVLYNCQDQIGYLFISMQSSKKDHQDGAESTPSPTFKEQLDQEAVESRTHQHESESGEQPTIKAVVDKSECFLSRREEL